MTGLSIGLYINEKLGGSPDLTALIGDKVFPISTQKEIDFPFVVYQRGGLTTTYTKDFLDVDTVEVTFIVASDKYFQSVEIAEALRAVLEGKRAKKYGITETKLVSANEDTVENTFVQTLVFSFKIDY
ncbi:tail completion protein gp17 [Phocaeicola sp.]